MTSRIFSAWDLIGFGGNLNTVPVPGVNTEDRVASVRTLGGRTLYEAVDYNDETGGTRVRLSRLDTAGGLRQINRYVDADTLLEVVV